jgi:hypothetical protein
VIEGRSPNSHWRPALEDREEDLDSAPDFPPLLPPEDIVDKVVGVGGVGCEKQRRGVGDLM